MNSEDWRARAEKAEAGYFKLLAGRAEALATARALAFAEAIEAITEAFEVDQDIAAIDVLKARAKLPPTLRAVPVCHICGSTDAVLTSTSKLCSKGHSQTPEGFTLVETASIRPLSAAGLVAVPVETLAKVRAMLADAADVGHGFDCDRDVDDDTEGHCECGLAQIRAALSLLPEVET